MEQSTTTDTGTGLSDIIVVPLESKPYRKVIVVDTLRTGQPRPYADHERVYGVEIRYYNHLGEMVNEPSSIMLKQDALAAVGGDRCVPIGERKTNTLENHARPYVESVEVTDKCAVMVIIREPYID